jgi:GNAT superfamily N-acetyltransferase
MTSSETFTVQVVDDPRSLHAIRRRVLREDDPAKSVEDARDGDGDAVHLAGLLGGRVVASASFFPAAATVNPGLCSFQLRYMAVDSDVQGRGLGTALLDAAETVLASRGAEQLWANGRDTALGFYGVVGWSAIEGSQHVSEETRLPHTVIYKVLRRDDPVEVRWATPRDAAALARLREEMHLAISLRRVMGEWVTSSVTYFAEEIATGAVIATVAEAPGKEVVASAVATVRRVAPSPRFPVGSIAYLHTVSTAPGFRRRGISRTLVVALIEELRRRGVERVELHATHDGEPLYRDLGFVDRGHGTELRLVLVDPIP